MNKSNSSWLKTFSIGFSIISFGITIAIIGYIVLTTKQNQPASQSSLAPTPDEPSPEKITENFYRSYIECLDYHFRYPSGSPRQDCPFDKFQVLSPEVLQKIETIKASDPILCAQNTSDPHSIKADKAVIVNNTATTTVHTYFESGDNPIKVSLENKNNEWKITAINCQ